MRGISRSIGAIVNKIEKVHDYLSIYFDNESILHIYNRVELSSQILEDYIGLELLEIQPNEWIPKPENMEVAPISGGIA
jgi:hypothetical protein